MNKSRNELITTQWGTEALPFSVHNGLEKIAAIERVMQIASEVALGADCYIALSYGTLLGTMRDGNLISHDFDFDFAFFPTSLRREDVITTSTSITRVLNGLDLPIKVETHGHLTAYFEVGGKRRAIDFFSGWVDSGRVMHYFAINGEVSESEYFPIGTGYLCGTKVPVPHDSDKVLKVIYGVDWKTPDPEFRHHPNFENYEFLFL
jgi:hypothetical protein